MTSAAVVSIVIVVAAAVLAGFTGFGFNIIAVPALALWLDAGDAVVQALVVGTAISFVAGSISRKEINTVVLRTLLLGSVPGLAVGILIIPLLDEAALRLCVGVATVALAMLLAVPKRRSGARDSHVVGWGVGMTSGSLTALLGMGGVPAAAYMLRRADGAEYVRSTMLGFVAATGMGSVALRSASGHLHIDQLTASGVLLAPALLGLFVGARLYRAAPSLHNAVSIGTIALLGALGVGLALSTNV